MPRTDHWPHEYTAFEDGRYKFAPLTVTIAKVFDGNKGVGWKFTQDETKDGEYTGVIWNSRGKWDQDTKTRASYNGPTFAVGQQVEVMLQVNEGDIRNFYDVLKIDLAAGAAPAAGANGAQPAAAGDGQAAAVDYGYGMDARDVSIREQAFYNHLNVELLLQMEAERQEALLQAYFDTAMRMMAPATRLRALRTLGLADGTELDPSTEGPASDIEGEDMTVTTSEPSYPAEAPQHTARMQTDDEALAAAEASALAQEDA